MNMMTKKRTGCRSSERGQATLEMLLVLMVLVPLFFGAIELVRAISLRHSLDAGAFLAARAVSLNPDDLTYPQTVVTNTVNQNVFGGGAISDFNPGTISWDVCPAGRVLGCRFSYTSSLKYTPWLPLIGGQQITITIRHHGIVEKLY